MTVLPLATGTGLLTLVTFTSGGTETGTFTATNALNALHGACGRLDVVQRHNVRFETCAGNGPLANYLN